MNRRNVAARADAMGCMVGIGGEFLDEVGDCSLCSRLTEL
jgi:hypothetical protein